MVEITERRKVEAALRFQAELLDTAGQAIVATDLTGAVVYWNRAAESLYGWSSADAIGRSIGELIVDGESTEEAEAIFEDLRKGQSWSGDYWVKHRDGKQFPVYVTDSPVFDHEGRLVAIVAVSVDVTERKAGEQAGRQLAAIVDGSGDAIFGVSPHAMVTSWNPAAERLFGYTAAEIIGQPISLLAPADKVAEQMEVRARVSASGSPERLETTRRRKDGTVVEVLLTVSPVADEAGAVAGLSVIVSDITERRGAQQALEATLRQLAEAQRMAHFGSTECNLLTGEITASEEYNRILGLDPGSKLTGEQLVSMIHPDDRLAAARMWGDAVDLGIPFDLACRIVRPDFEQRWVRLHIVPEVADDGTVVKVIGTLLDETERVAADRVRREAETRFEIGFEQAGIGAGILDLQGIPMRVNPAVCAILGRPANLLVGRSWTEYESPHDLPLAQAVRASLAAGHDTYADERRFIRPDGTVVWASIHITLVRDETGVPAYYLAQLQDINERKRLEQELAHQALHDTLTGLPNRALLTDRLVQGLAHLRRRSGQLGVIFLDVDQFKVVNDSFGHSTGDDLLRHAAHQIAEAIRPGDTVARFGGDEFVVVCDEVSVAEAGQIAERVLEALSQPFHIGTQELHVKASLGIAVADEYATPESLLRDADFAMYRAKERGRARIEIFDEEMRSKAERRSGATSALHRATPCDVVDIRD